MSAGARPDAPRDATQDLTEPVVTLLVEDLHIDVPDVTSDLVDLGLLDSLGFTRLFVLLEERFGVAVELADMDLENFRSAERIVSFISSRPAGGDPSSEA